MASITSVSLLASAAAHSFPLSRTEWRDCCTTLSGSIPSSKNTLDAVCDILERDNVAHSVSVIVLLCSDVKDSVGGGVIVCVFVGVSSCDLLMVCDAVMTPCVTENDNVREAYATEIVGVGVGGGVLVLLIVTVTEVTFRVSV